MGKYFRMGAKRWGSCGQGNIESLETGNIPKQEKIGRFELLSKIKHKRDVELD